MCGSKIKKIEFQVFEFFFFKRTGCGKERSPESHHEDGLLQDTWPGNEVAVWEVVIRLRKQILF